MFQAEKTDNATIESKQTPIATVSKRVKVIWGLNLHTWEHLMLAALAIVGIAGVAAALATGFVVKLQRVSIKESSEELEKYKLDAGEKIATADAKAAEAKIEVAKANERTAALTLEADKARLDLEKLRVSVAWRELSKEQARKLVALLAGFRGDSASIVVSWANGNSEAASFAEEIAQTLRKAGLNAELADGEFTTANSVGILVRTNGSLLANALLAGFHDAGLVVNVAKEWHPAITIRVGAKPRK